MNKIILAILSVLVLCSFTSPASAASLTSSEIAELIKAEKTINETLAGLQAQAIVEPSQTLTKNDLTLLGLLENQEDGVQVLLTNDNAPPDVLAAENNINTVIDMIIINLIGKEKTFTTPIRQQEMALAMAYATLGTAAAAIPSAELATLIQGNATAMSGLAVHLN